MNINQNTRFALNPTSIDISRSRFNMNHSIKTTFNVGELWPVDVQEVLPGDTFNVTSNKIVRMPSLITPMMDNLYLDTYHFFVPMRLCWEHTKQFFGENTESSWIPETEYTIPQVTSPEGGWNVGTIADGFGIPTGVSNLSIDALIFRAYALICNEWFRDENLTDPLNIPLNDSTLAGSNGNNYINDIVKGGKPFQVAKYFDFFTSCLPGPQRGSDVTIKIAELTGAVVGNGYTLGLTDGANNAGLTDSSWSYGQISGKSAAVYTGVYGQQVGTSQGGTELSAKKGLGVPTLESLGEHPEYSGLTAVLNDSVNIITINQLRQAFQIQKFLEKSARGGSRYIETLKVMFGVTSPDARLQRPEYLGGNRVPLSVNQVVQSSQTTDTSPQGNVAGYSVTQDSNHDYTRSFTEHGYVITLVCVRYHHTYQQGLAKKFSRKTKFDYYWPVFANLGEMPILNKQIYAQGNSQDNEVFGYQEAWAEYRYAPNTVTGAMRSTYNQSLDSWHLGDYYTELPKLSDEWIREDKTNVNRVIAVSDTLAPQLFADIYIEMRATRAMPVYSIPGLIDHH